MRPPRRDAASRWWLIAALAPVVLGCTYIGTTDLAAAGDQAAGLPFVERVAYRPENIIDHEELDVTVADDAEPDEIRTLWCDVLVPGGADDSNTVVMYPSSRSVTLPACPGRTAPATAEQVTQVVDVTPGEHAVPVGVADVASGITNPELP